MICMFPGFTPYQLTVTKYIIVLKFMVVCPPQDVVVATSIDFC